MAVVNHTVWVTGVQVTPEKILIFAQDFPGGPVVKNLPTSVGDVGSIAGRGTKTPKAEERLSPSTTLEFQCTETKDPAGRR